MEPTLVILAAGIGSRYGGLKQIEPVGPNGEIVIDYSICDALRAGFGRLVFVIRRDIEEAFRGAIGRRHEGRAEVRYVYQELDRIPHGFSVPKGRERPWGTAHAVMVAEDAATGPFGVINADDFYGERSFRLLREHLASSRDTAIPEYNLVGFTLRNTLSAHGSVARGVCRTDDDGYLAGIVERLNLTRQGEGAVDTDREGNPTRFTGDEIVSMNMWGFTPPFFGSLREQFHEFLRREGQAEKSEFLIPSVVDRLIEERRARVKVIPSPETWLGVTYPEDRPEVSKGICRLVEEGAYPRSL